MMMMMPFHLQKWIEQNRELLKPPVGNKCLYPNHEFIIMIIGGPNTRTDYHINEGEEFFYQLEGDIVLKIKEGQNFRDIPIKEGEIFLLPPKVPHSPQRPPHTIGLVIERQLRPGEMAGFEWYCDQCQHLLYRESIKLTSIEKDLPEVFGRYWGNLRHTTCQKCGHLHEKPWSKKIP